ncbi:hypothetical protein SLE2022_295340 [Rubroshorea leprosula]
MRKVVQKARSNDTMLTAWFKANQTYESARNLTYVRFPMHFVWNKKDSIWTEMKKGFSFGRVYSTHLASGERFYLRLLLNVVKGCTSFKDLKTVNGTTYATFQQACKEQGLIRGDQQYKKAMNKAYIWGGPH